ncbi:hypothetical protein [Streptomyces tritici]|uniref:hypothetical protein n=1 Tax=Streptomyces tritici TaxID=2054410 RepID=UPI003AF16037
MSNPQTPQQRRSGRGGATPQESASRKAGQSSGPPEKRGRPHGTDKGERGGGEGGGVPPDQRGRPDSD